MKRFFRPPFLISGLGSAVSYFQWRVDQSPLALRKCYYTLVCYCLFKSTNIDRTLVFLETINVNLYRRHRG
jgi:hypothetical protein